MKDVFSLKENSMKRIVLFVAALALVLSSVVPAEAGCCGKFHPLRTAFRRAANALNPHAPVQSVGAFR